MSEPENSLELILAHVLEKKTLSEVRGDALKALQLTDEQLKRLEELCSCRSCNMPVQYLLKEWEFHSILLKMKPPVFIPRPETEELVTLITQQLDPLTDHQILEVGCGTGAISLSLLKALPNVKQIIAIDQSKLACELTMENAQHLEISHRLRVFKHRLETDQLPPEILSIASKFDIIVSNPPYVPSSDIKKLEPDIYLYEDLKALDGGRDGLDVVRILLKLAAKYLKPSGVLWIEVDSRHPEIIEKLIESNKDWLLKFVSSYKDIYRNERFVEIHKIDGDSETH